MEQREKDFLYALFATPSPSGFEQPIQKVVRDYVKGFADEVKVDVHGNLIAIKNPNGKVKVMLAGHCDQIGMMVTYIDDKGFIYFKQIGGIDPTVVPGTNLVIHTANGPVNGVIGFKPIHLIKSEERGKKLDLSKLWIDIGAKSGEEAKKIVRVGDPITYRLAVTELGNNRISTPACDDKTGVFVVMNALKLFSEFIQPLGGHDVALYAVSTVQEEVGLRGARTSCYGINPVAGIAVDVTFASDDPGVDAKEIGTVNLGDGPVVSRGANINPVLEKIITTTADEKGIKYQIEAAPGATGTDANAIQITQAGVAAALISIPNRYMHTQVETVELEDLENAAKLVAEAVVRINAETSFIP
jgi:endoglucanase